VLGVGLTLRLGFWQLDRAAQKIALHERLEARRVLPALRNEDLARSAGDAEGQLDRRVVLRGRWLADRTVFLDNRQMSGQAGFFVVTPLAIDGRIDAVVVQRGWAPRNFIDRSVLPVIDTPTGTVEVHGLFAPPPARLYEFAPSASGAIRQNLDLEAYARESRANLLPMSVLQLPSPSTTGDGLRREWPAPALGVDRHYGYAVQWFALAALMTGMYVWFQFVRRRRQS